MFTATRKTDDKTWNYLVGNFHTTRSVGLERAQHLQLLAHHNNEELLIAAQKDGQFTQWKPWFTKGHKYKDQAFTWEELQTAYDLHRSILDNEIIVESDYPTYEDNADAARIIGAIIESKGFTPHYYYSGSKSIHIHIFLNKAAFNHIDRYVVDAVKAKYASPTTFRKKFMEWLRTLMVQCWGTGARTFDEQLIRASHLIRAEGSQNKRGFKTFLGYTYRDIPPFPIICNPETGIVAEIGEMQLSSPPCIQEIVEEFLAAQDKKAVKLKEKRKERQLDFFLHGPEVGLKGCVRFMLSDEFKTATDGFQRASFFIANDLKRAEEPNPLGVLLDWNVRMGEHVPEQDLAYRVARANVYDTSHATIHEFLRQIGFSDPDACCTGHADKEERKV